MTAAIAAGGSLESLLVALQGREQRRAHVRVALAEQERQQAAQRDPSAALDVMRAALAAWQATLRAETSAARTALQALLAGRLVFTPVEQDGRRGYKFEGPGTIEPIVGVVLKGISPRTRTIPPALHRALQHRDRGCRFPGCHARFGQGHHIRHWAHGGPTTLSNFALVCTRHHRAVHEEDYQVERRANGELRFRHPYGHAIPHVPPRMAIADDPVRTILASNEAEGEQLVAHSATPGWLGERLNVAYALDVLHPLASAVD